MKEIIFKGKSQTTGQWVQGDFLTPNHIVTYSIDTDDDMPIEEIAVSRDSVGMFTGYKDDSNLRIFEGDVIRDNLNNIAYVQYDEGAFFAIFSKCKFPLMVFYREGITIVGNIFDIPDYLDKTTYELALIVENRWVI